MKSGDVRIGAVIYDPNTRTLTYLDGRPAQLRNKSKQVLSFLVKHCGRTLSKTEIMDEVWTDVTVSDGSLVQCIADIRRVIGPSARRVVETVPREGYRLNAYVESPIKTRVPVQLALVAAAAFGLALFFWPDSEANQPQLDPPPTAEVRSTPPGTGVTEACLEVLKGSISASRFNQDESLAAERHFRRAIDLDPTYARAYAELGTLFAVRLENDWTVLQDADREKALFYANEAVELDPDYWMAHYALGRLHSVLTNLDAAENHLKRAMSLQPDNEDARAYYGIVRNFRGDAQGAIDILEPALASHPNPPFWYYLGLGNALFNAGRYEHPAAALTKCLDLAGNSPYCLRYLIAVYGKLGRVDDATQASRAYASHGFEPSIGSIMELMTFHTPMDRELLESAFRAAGLQE